MVVKGSPEVFQGTSTKGQSYQGKEVQPNCDIDPPHHKSHSSLKISPWAHPKTLPRAVAWVSGPRSPVGLNTPRPMEPPASDRRHPVHGPLKRYNGLGGDNFVQATERMACGQLTPRVADLGDGTRGPIIGLVRSRIDRTDVVDLLAKQKSNFHGAWAVDGGGENIIGSGSLKPVIIHESEHTMAFWWQLGFVGEF